MVAGSGCAFWDASSGDTMIASASTWYFATVADAGANVSRCFRRDGRGTVVARNSSPSRLTSAAVSASGIKRRSFVMGPGGS